MHNNRWSHQGTIPNTPTSKTSDEEVGGSLSYPNSTHVLHLLLTLYLNEMQHLSVWLSDFFFFFLLKYCFPVSKRSAGQHDFHVFFCFFLNKCMFGDSAILCCSH